MNVTGPLVGTAEARDAAARMTGTRTERGNVMSTAGNPELLTPAEVAAMFRVHPKTVTRWAKAGKLNCIRTLGGNGGHRRFYADEVRALLNADASPQAPEATP